jgi:hypothetical protein
MALNQRERVLAWGAGALVTIAAVQFSYSYLQSLFDERQSQIEALNREISDKDATVLRGKKAKKKLDGWQHRSLPSDVVLARSLYKNWLARLLERTRLAKADVTLGADLPKPGVYVKIPVNVRGQGTIEQVVQFLYDFYQADHLHYIRQMTLTPLATSAPPAVAADAKPPEGAAVPTTGANAAPSGAPRGPIGFGGRGGFGGFGGRGGFGPPGGFAGFGRGGPSSEGLKYELILAIEALALPGAENTNRLSDAKSDRLAFKEFDDYRKTISERGFFSPYMPPIEADPAADTFVTAVVKKEGKYEAWINLRSSGKTLKLHEGDTFELGKQTATVAKIDRGIVEIDMGGRRRPVALGKSLAEERGRRGGFRGRGPVQ